MWRNGCDWSLLRSHTSDACRRDEVSWHGVPARRSWADLQGFEFLYHQWSSTAISRPPHFKELWRTNFTGWCQHRAYEWSLLTDERPGQACQSRTRQENPALSCSLIHDRWCFLYRCCLQSDKFNAKNTYMVLTLKHQKKYFYLSTSVG